jgi:hypothetical protein
MRKLKDFLARLVRRGLHVPVAAAFAFVATGGIALALTNPPTFAPRLFTWQLVHYERHLIGSITATGFSVDQGQLGQACSFSSGSCSVKIGAVPYNSFILRGNWFQVTVCNAATTCTMSIGTASGGAQIVSAQDIKTVAAGAPALTIVTAGQGAQATGNGIAQTGADGGFDLWVTVAFTGAAPTTGSVVFDLEYLAPNDGNCIAVPIGGGTTAPAC